MSYEELIAKALKGRKPAQAARDWQIPAMTLYRYVTGERVPDYETAILIMNEAGVTPAYLLQTMAEQQAKLKSRTPRKQNLQMRSQRQEDLPK